MSVYDKNGDSLSAVYGKNGTTLSQAYDKSGNELIVDPDIPVTPMTWNITDANKTRILSTLETIKTYQNAHSGAYSICQFNDVHTNFDGNEPNFVDYNKGYKVISRMLFLGDMVDRASVSYMENAVAYIQGAQASKVLVGMGNHEYWMQSETIEPEPYYRPLTTIQCTWMDDDNCIFYNDDDVNNVRYIVLDYFNVYKSPSDSKHYISPAQQNWLAGAMASAGGKDIIIAAHSMFNPFISQFTNAELNSSADTTEIKGAVVPVITAFKNRSSISITVDGVSHTHDFSSCTGNFIMYTSGHYHTFGLQTNDGFNMFTCVARSGSGWNGQGDQAGFTFFVIDKTARKIKVFICFTNTSSYDAEYEFSY